MDVDRPEATEAAGNGKFQSFVAEIRTWLLGGNVESEMNVDNDEVFVTRETCTRQRLTTIDVSWIDEPVSTFNLVAREK